MSGAILLAIVSLHGLANAGPLNDTVWNLTGTATVRSGSVSQTEPISETLTLNADRTYLLHENGSSGPDEVGAWFEYRGNVQLFPQNLLDFVEWLEQQISAEPPYEPVRISPIKYSQTASLDSKTGMLRLRSSLQIGAFFQSSNLALTLSGKSNATGMQVP